MKKHNIEPSDVTHHIDEYYVGDMEVFPRRIYEVQNGGRREVSNVSIGTFYDGLYISNTEQRDIEARTLIVIQFFHTGKVIQMKKVKDSLEASPNRPACVSRNYGIRLTSGLSSTVQGNSL